MGTIFGYTHNSRCIRPINLSTIHHTHTHSPNNTDRPTGRAPHTHWMTMTIKHHPGGIIKLNWNGSNCGATHNNKPAVVRAVCISEWCVPRPIPIATMLTHAADLRLNIMTRTYLRPEAPQPPVARCSRHQRDVTLIIAGNCWVGR